MRWSKVLIGAALVLVALGLAAAWLLGFFTPEPQAVTLAEAIAITAEEPVESDASIAPTTTAAPAEAPEIADEPASPDSPAEATTAQSTTAPATTAEETSAVETSPDETSPDETVAPAGLSGSEITLTEGGWSVVAGDATFAGYRATGRTGEAVGRSPGVTGSLEVAESTVTSVVIVVDMTRLASDSGLRDDHLGDEGIAWRTFPEASFVLDVPIALPTGVDAQEQLEFAAAGTLTVRSVPRSVTVELEAALVDEQLVVVGSTPISLDDFGAGIGGVNDDATMEFSLIFTPPQ